MDPLKILIEADASGLEAQFKSISRNIESLVGQMNGQSVNWEKILAGALNPAIITAIAGMFASAISSALNFQNAVTTTTDTSNQAFVQNADTAKQASLAIQSSTGQSADAVYEALGTTTGALGDYGKAFAEVSEAAKMATATHLPFKDLVSEFTPVMQAWGVSAADIPATMEHLFGIAQEGDVPLSQMLDTMAQTGVVLKANGGSLEQSAGDLENYSNQVVKAGGNSQDAVKIFTTVSNNLASVATSAGNSVVGMGSYNQQIKTLQSSGVGGLLDAMDTHFKNIGISNATIEGTGIFGAADAQVAAKTAQSATGIAKATADGADSAKIMGTNEANTLDTSAQLLIAWGKFKTLILEVGTGLLPIVKGIATVGLNLLSLVIDPLNNIITLVTNWQNIMDQIANVSKVIGDTTTTTASSDALNKATDKYQADQKAGTQNSATGLADKAAMLAALGVNTSNLNNLNADLAKGASPNVASGPSGANNTVYNNNSTTILVNTSAITSKAGVQSVGRDAQAHAGVHGYP